MPRITIALPPSFIFSTEIAVRITDINYGNHVGNDALLGMVQEARVRFLASHGWSEKEVGGAGGPGIIMADAAVVYLAQVRYGQTLRVEIGVAEPSRVGCTLVYRITDVASNREVAHVSTGIAFFDYGTNRVARMPEPFRALLPAEPAGQ